METRSRKRLREDSEKIIQFESGPPAKRIKAPDADEKDVLKLKDTPLYLLDLPPELLFHITKFIPKEDIIWWKRTCPVLRHAVQRERPEWNRMRMFWDSCTQSLARVQYEIYKNKPNVIPEAYCHAAQNGRTDVILWLKTIMRPVKSEMAGFWIYVGAARGGHIDILKWAIREGYVFDCRCISDAAEYGQLHILKWLVKNEYAKPEEDFCACDGAAIGGHLDILKWLRRKDFRLYNTAAEIAARHGHLHIIQYMIETGVRVREEWVCNEAARGGHLKILQWLKEIGIGSENENYRYAVPAAAGKGDLQMLKWLKENGAQLNAPACAAAAGKGNFHILRWLRKNGCPWYAITISQAARYGHLNIIQYARRNGCPWDSGACYEAAGGGHLHVLKWLYENGCPWSCHARREAVRNKDWKMLYWIDKNGLE